MNGLRISAFLTLSLGAFAGGAADLQGAPGCSSTQFLQPLTTPIQGTFAATGLLDGDSFVDVVTASSSLGVLVYLGRGDGTFDDPVAFPAGSSISALAAADFNDDGNLDVVVTEYDEVQVLLGNGDGTLQLPIETDTDVTFLNGLVPAAIDTDTAPDLIVRTQYDGRLLFLKGNGDGTFSPPTLISTGEFALPVLGHLDGDADLDMVTFLGSGVRVRLGHGDGSFDPPVFYVAGSGASSVAVADLDGDGDADLSLTVSGYVAVLEGNGDGTFQASRLYGRVGSSSQSIAVGDFDENSIPDVAFVNRDGNGIMRSLSVMLGQATGALTPPLAYSGISTDISLLIVEDFNADGHADLGGFSLESFYGGNPSLSVLLGTGLADFSAPLFESGTLSLHNVFSGDFDRDGILDLVGSSAPNGESEVFLLLGKGNGRFEAGPSYQPSNYVVSIALCDFDGDGNLDVAALNYFEGTVSVLLGNGDGTLRLPIESTTLVQSWRILAADWNSDGRLDLAVVQISNSSAAATVDVLVGNGTGAFVSSSSTNLPIFPVDLIARDVTGDGRLDLVAVGVLNEIVILDGAGDGSFGAARSYSTGGETVSVETADLDEDGTLDLIAANGRSQNLSILFGSGGGDFEPWVGVGLGSEATDVDVTDLDGDGHTDLIVADGFSIVVLRGLGDGGFETPESSLGSEGRAVLIGDFVPNGIPDVILSTPQGAGFSVFRNTRLGVSAPASNTVCSGESTSFSVTASGFGPVSYQWRKGGIPLTDGGAVSGATTATLTITGAAPGDAGSYDVVVTDSCTSVTSAAASLSVSAVPGTPAISASESVPPATGGLVAAVPPVAGRTWAWTLTGGTIESGQGTNQVSYTSGPAGTVMTLQVVETNSPSCSSGPATVFVVSDFSDVPAAHPLHDFVVRLARNGVSAGCGSGNFCPNSAVTRAQMAVFLLRAKNGPAYTPPTATGTVFGDVPAGGFAADWIEALAAEGITGGCGGGSFCPSGLVTRAQMAVFLLRARHGSSYSPPAATGTVFGDVPAGGFAAAWIEALAGEGFTGGCGGGNYCPDGLVTRGQMAVLLVSVFDLL